ncbi:MAG TPA: glycosyltransferase family 4 protein [Desulfobacteraceae bacterium]|nr:glycosyltransferase family 4 protein [Desulfobacteraceae bacterium]HPJ66389.1 glycosyltransferase family 4 protein [Desulfobacteraceae bacterium]HPQ27311.1 glycosyltransferase family 4 protein [Desulfobacteraceae bacterium]
MVKILFVTDVPLWPLNGGERIRCYNIVRSLSENFQVALLSPRLVKVEAQLETVSEIYELLIPPVSNLNKALKIWHTFFPRRDWNNILYRICDEFRPDVVWFDYGHWGQYVPLVRSSGAKTIMGTHNIQSQLPKHQAKILPLNWRNFVALANFIFQYCHERFLFQRFDRLISVSKSDSRYHGHLVGEGRSLVIPNYLNENLYVDDRHIKREENLLVMTGNFDSFQNKYGAIWFIRDVWPLIQKQLPEARLELIGRGSRIFGKKFGALPNVWFLGEVSDIIPHLRQAALSVVPLFHGSGTRFKILEALACATPVVSTSLGAEGLGLIPDKEITIADNAYDFSKEIIGLLKSPSKRRMLAQNGRKIISERYGFQVNTERIKNAILDFLEVL